MSFRQEPDAIVPVFLPRRGCPARCSFCDQQVQSGTSRAAGPADAADGLARELAAIRDRGRRGSLAFYGGSFDGLPDSERSAWLDMASAFADAGLLPGRVRVSAHPAGLTPPRLRELADGGVGTVEVGVQSLDDAVLSGVHRGHDAATALAACELVKTAGMSCVVQLMAGLPGADAASDEATAAGIAEVLPNGVRIHPTLVLRGTALEELLRANEWAPPDLDEAVERVARMVEILEQAGVPVLRLGIQDVSGLKERVVAGAWHPAFGELVRGELLARRLARELGPCGTVVKVPNRERSWLLGHGRRGLRRLERLAGRRPRIAFGGEDRFE